MSDRTAHALCASALIAWSVLLPAEAANPEQAARLTGTVSDQDGLPVAKAQVLASCGGRVTAASTNDAGRFEFLALPAGDCSIRTSTADLTEERQTVGLNAGSNPELSFALGLAAVRTEVTVTSETARVKELDEVPQQINIISRSDLNERAPTVLTEAIRDSVGVTEQRTSSFMSSISVRGLTGKNVSVYRDGVRYSTSVQRGGVSTFLNLNEPGHLEGLEIVRGPSSAQYNSDSLGGTVHLLSRSAAFAPEGRAVRAEISGSMMSAARAASTSALVSYSTRRFAALSSVTLRDNNDLRTGGGVDSRAAVSRFLGLRSDILGSRLQGTGYAQYGGVTRFQYAPTPLTQITLHYERNQQDGARRYDQLLGGDGNLIADVRNLALDFGYVRFSAFRAGPFDHVSATTSYNTQREERVNQGGNGNPKGAISHQYERVKSNGANVFASRQAGRNEFLMGADVYRERVVAPAYTFDPVSGAVVAARPRVPHGSQYLLYGGYVQNALQLLSNRLRVSGSLRYGGASYVSLAANSPLVAGKALFPDDRFHANNLSGRIGAVLTVIPTLGLYGNYSRGFRAPNITDLGTLGLQGNGMFEAAVADLARRNATIGHRADDQAESTGRPVAGLRPETSDNYELGARFRTDRLSASLTGFVMDVRNSIVSQTLILPPGVAGSSLGDQTIVRQLPTGAVVVPLSANPVQVRTNMGGMRTFGVEHTFDIRIRRTLFWRSNATWLYARDLATGLPPDMEGGTPPLMAHGALRYMPTSRPWWVEVYGTVAGKQNRLSSLALSDRRIGAGRSRSNIASFFNNGARVRGLVSAGPDGRPQTSDDVLMATGETLDQVQNRVLGDARSAPMFPYLASYAFAGIRGGFRAGEKTDASFDFSNILDRNYRAMGGGIDAPGRHITVAVRRRF